jgi:photosystem II stability/assembly factor-like uncharacterized protein
MRLVIDPRDSNRLFLGGWPGTDMDRPCEAYRSDDGGDSWKMIVASRDGGCLISVDARDSVIYRAGGWDRRLYRSVDNGESWQQFGSGLTSEVGDLTQILPHPGDSRTLWLLTEGSQLYQSSDDGATFSPVEGIENVWQSILLAHPAGQQLYFIANHAFYHSEDGGESWRRAGYPDGYFLAGAVDPSNPDVLYLGSTHKGLFRSTNGGQSWSKLPALPAASINDIAIDPTDSQTLYAATDKGAFISRDGGDAWTPLQSGLGPNPIVYSVAVDPNDSSHVFAVTPDGVYRLINAGFADDMPARLDPELALKAAVSSARTDPTASFSVAVLQAMMDREPSYQDDFSDPGRGFGENHEGGGFARNQNGVYVMEAPPDRFSNSWRPADFFPHTDLAVQLDMRLDAFQSSFPRDGQIFLRWSPAGDYGFELNYESPKLHYQLGIHRPSSQYTYLANRNLVSTSPDSGVGTWHNMIAIIKGDTLAYFVDGALVAAVEDDTFSQGSFLIGAGSGTAMQVDNLRIWDISDLP